MQRIGEHLLDRPLLDDLARVHHEDLVGDVARCRQVVRDVEEREVALLFQLQHQVEDPDANRDVEHARRLVGEHDLGLDGQRARDCDALALSAGELVRVLRGDLVGRRQADGPQQLVDALVELRRAARSRGAAAAGLEMVADRLDRIERAERILEDDLHLRAVAQIVLAAPQLASVAALEEHRAAGRRVQAREQARDRALAAAALTDERRDRARPELERDVVDRVNLRPVELAAEQGSASRGSVTSSALTTSLLPARWQATW